MKPEETIYRIGTWILGSLLVGSVTMGVNTLEKLSNSVNDLNYKIGIVIERTDIQQKKIEDHEDRLRSVEKIKKP